MVAKRNCRRLKILILIYNLCVHTFLSSYLFILHFRLSIFPSSIKPNIIDFAWRLKIDFIGTKLMRIESHNSKINYMDLTIFFLTDTCIYQFLLLFLRKT